mmetsp:Transcript_47086/g.86329  ORF Transcript_47086/g.86329 Transcript_47086/m.86329 type:complete len:369 (+) Transcript_47086:91-1197(+)
MTASRSEQTRALVRLLDVAEGSGSQPLLERDSGEVEASKEEVVQRCRPSNKEDYVERLNSFRPWWWFNKPLVVSPIECSRRGWVNCAADTVECKVCSALWTLQKGKDDKWLLDGVATTQDGLRRALVEGHGHFCPWRSCEVTKLSKLSDEDLASEAEARLQVLQKALQHEPVLPKEYDGDVVLEVLARAGWEYAGYAEVGGQTAQYLRCSSCVRLWAVEGFQHRAPEGSASSPDQPKVDEADGGGGDAAGERPAKRPKLNASSQVLAAQPSHWSPPLTRKSKEPGQVVEAAGVFDPYALHRHYCPYYSQSSDGLSSVATKVIMAIKARHCPVAADADVLEGDVSSAMEAVVGQAEELLLQLDKLLPAL